MIFVAYVSAVVDRWYCSELSKDKGQASQGKARCVDLKCKYLSERANVISNGLPTFEFKKLRNRIAHLPEGQDLKIFRDLSMALLEEGEAEMIGWLDQTGRTLGYGRHRSTAKVAEELHQSGEIRRCEGTAP